jgi:hypothetical protein
MLEQIVEENVPRNTTYMMQTPKNKKAIMDDAYSNKRVEVLDKVSSFGKGKMVTESEKMIMGKNKPVMVKKSIKVMKKPKMM